MALRPRPSRGSELLVGWRGNRAQTEIAEKLEIASETYNRFERGKRVPNLKYASAIETLTDGAVPASSWFDPPLNTTVRKRKAAAA